MEDIIYDYWAATLQDGYIGKLTDIVKEAGSARTLYEMKAEHMRTKLHMSDRMVRHIINNRDGIDIEKGYEEMKTKGINYVNHNDIDFPLRLKNIPSCPYGLFVKGKLPDDGRKAVSIVGSRECSEYGRLMAEYLGDRLAQKGIDIISGMAWGIDGIAQMSAVKAGGNSYAVLGCGADVIYPRKNYRLYEYLTENGNGVISEYAPGTQAQSRLFPPRNRIISGLCDVLIVVEARAKSGTLITVDMANDQGRNIMVVPGRLTDPLSVGCLNLMREGAIPVTCIDDVLEELEDHCRQNEAPAGKITERQRAKSISGTENPALPPNEGECLRTYPEGGLKKESDGNRGDRKTVGKTQNEDDAEAEILKLIGIDPISAEELKDRLHKPVNEVLILLTELEVKGMIREAGNFMFVKNTPDFNF